MPDGSGTRARIGVLTRHLDAVPESEFQALAPAGISIHSARIPLGMVGPDGEIIPHVDADIARAFAESPAVDDAASLLSAVEPKAIVFAFTSSRYILGADEDAKLRDRLAARTKNIPVIIQSSALVVALQTLHAERIALIHPPWFSDDLDALGAAYFQDQGIDVVWCVGCDPIEYLIRHHIPVVFAEFCLSVFKNVYALVLKIGGSWLRGEVRTMSSLRPLIPRQATFDGRCPLWP